MSKSLTQFVISLLQGASWALVIIISTYLFFHMLPYGYVMAFFSALFGSFIGLFFVSFFELINIELKNLEESKKQTKLLQDILENLTPKS